LEPSAAYHRHVDVEQLSDPGSFGARARPLLLADEARHNLILGLLTTIAEQPGYYPEQRFWLVRDGGDVVGAAMQTPPHNLIVARPQRAEALDALAASIGDDLPGVTGARPEAEIFAELWAARTRTRPRVEFEQRIYALTKVVPPRPAPGFAREARRSERSLLLGWFRDFTAEALHDPEPDEERLAANVDVRLDGTGAGLLVWDDGEPVSLAGWGGRTPNGIRIGPVYTPPELRGRGYASAVVAALSEARLAAGSRFCFLYTDLANPTSNRIYADVGYGPVCDSLQYAFGR
jgi:predicted GNAT family acetyltransferase